MIAPPSCRRGGGGATRRARAARRDEGPRPEPGRGGGRGLHEAPHRAHGGRGSRPCIIVRAIAGVCNTTTAISEESTRISLASAREHAHIAALGAFPIASNEPRLRVAFIKILLGVPLVVVDLPPPGDGSICDGAARRAPSCHKSSHRTHPIKIVESFSTGKVVWRSTTSRPLHVHVRGLDPWGRPQAGRD